VSRERIGSEVDLMVRSARPTQAMTLIGDLGLAPTVFPAPEDLVVEAEGEGEMVPATWYVRDLLTVSFCVCM
jgi:tRNA nucleotidyltransferase/poly(A) polymerase